LSLALQATLLQVLQDLRFSRVGGHGVIEVDMRVIAATNRHVERAIERGEFRADLYYRLDVVDIHIPPLRERREEIPHLASVFLSRFNEQYGRQKQLSPETLARLMEHPWAGDVRELENAIRRMVVLTDGEQAFQASLGRRRNGPAATAAAPAPAVAESLREIARRAAREAERTALAEVLDRVHWNRAEAARILKVSYKTLLNKISECELVPPPRRNFPEPIFRPTAPAGRSRGHSRLTRPTQHGRDFTDYVNLYTVVRICRQCRPRNPAATA
jgi:two-component system response regulator AtoC